MPGCSRGPVNGSFSLWEPPGQIVSFSQEQEPETRDLVVDADPYEVLYYRTLAGCINRARPILSFLPQ
jgi:hypothetical protein